VEYKDVNIAFNGKLTTTTTTWVNEWFQLEDKFFQTRENYIGGGFER
jgi:hypothetical protein